ncbi:type II toxin-antitoxin system PemK/MazF family toxin [Skermanella aerolata]|uniref:type II toxin-antitoxin system PemK/MazF family toxin n=1 Tax=Skermanella aerolata TaxID=393310 RepID=UPI001B3B8A3D|nr:type II toxin-antitoxin system PemK/MazF family toxin [Skermanella aerolata]
MEGTQDQPCVIMLATEGAANGTVITVAPITHSPPQDDAAVEIPAATKQRHGLDAERSWVVISEVIRFVWAGPHLRPISRENAGRFDYGMLPPALFTRIRNLLVENARQRRIGLVVRQE